jgi:PAS domain S-box-containing protein
MPQRTTIRILMIDDDLDDAILVREVVRELAHFNGTLTSVETFDAGLALLLGPSTPDVCLLDLRLGERTGLELIREARTAGSLVPIIVLTGGKSSELDVEILRAGGSDYVMKHELNGSTLDRSIRYAIERARAVEELQRSEARFRALIEDFPHAIFVHRDGRFVYVNPSALRYLGHDSADRMVGQSMLGFVHQDERAELDQRATSVMAGQQTDSDLHGARVWRLLRADGTHAKAELVLIRVLFDGAPALLTVARDVSVELDAKARLLLSDRRVAVGTLSAGVAHEINNPLAYVLSNVGYASEELTRRARDPKVAEVLAGTLDGVLEALRDAREGARRVDAIVKDLQSFSRADDGQRGPVDVRRVVQLAANLAENEVRHRARLIVVHGDVPPVDANEARLSEVFLNLLQNAAHAIPDGADTKNEIRIASTVEGQRVVVRVTDSGTGIPPEILGRVFDPFFTTKPVDVGTGLGLFVSRNIIHALGGELTIESRRDVGTTVTVSLPALTTTTRAATLGPPASSRRGRVMVIDDEPMVGSSLSRNLIKHHDVVALTSAREALDLITAGERFDVIFCDLMMPGMTGMDFYEELSSRFPALLPSIIFFTGGAFTPRASAFLARVPNTQLEKPAEMETIRKLLDARIRPAEKS